MKKGLDKKVLAFLRENNTVPRVVLQKEFGDVVKRVVSLLKSKGLVSVVDLQVSLTKEGLLHSSPTFCECCECDPCDCDWGM